MAKVYHQAIAKKYGLLNKTVRPFEYRPSSILENESYKLYWDTFITTDRSVKHNRPDILLHDKKGKTVVIIDVAIPADDNLSKAFIEKLTKYHDLAFELKTIHSLQSTAILPLVMSTNGLVEKHLVENTQRLELDKEVISTAQKEVILANTRLVSTLGRDSILLAPVTRSKTQGGREAQTDSLRNRPDDRSGGGTCGASGAPLRDGTARPNPASPQGESPGSLSVQTVHSAERRQQRDRRTRWTRNDNCMVMRAHFIAMDLADTLNTTYRNLLVRIWNDIFPDRPTYAQLLSNRASCFPGTTVQETTDPSETVGRRSSTGIRRSGLFVREQEEVAVEACLASNLMRFAGLAAEDRPKIPRLKFSKVVHDGVQRVNSGLLERVARVGSLKELVGTVYAGAATVCELLGQRIEQYQDTLRTTNLPPWRLRLEKNITGLRKKIGVIHTYLNSVTPSAKVLRAVRKVASEARIRRRDPSFREKVAVVSDQLKQKIKALGNRIRRYNERVKRHRNNNLFIKNQKQFFRDLEEGERVGDGQLKPEAAHSFWSNVWSRESVYDEGANWIGEAQSRIPGGVMDDVGVQRSDVSDVLRHCGNWASPGPDKLHNYWWKYFTSVHEKLAALLQEALNNPSTVPEFFTMGITYLIPKSKNSEGPGDYRPITCLPSVYKILTGVLAKYINKHLKEHNMMAEEQGGCRMKTKGCKELLVIDNIITKQARKKLRSISVAWVDYKKAFDSVPHTWLLKVLEMHGISQKVIELLKHLMKTWRTALSMRSGNSAIRSEQIKINRGIFQGDTLSPIWFCLALNPLSLILKNTKYGYVISKTRQVAITHRLFMDDLKLYGANSEQLRRMLEIVAAFSESIGMEMGLDKCAVLDVRRGKIQDRAEGATLMNNITIPDLEKDIPYRYLGIKQALEVKTPEMKESFREKLMTRVRLLLRAKLNSKSLFTAVNIWAIPSVAYSFGVISWSATELRDLDGRVRSLLTKYGVHHPTLQLCDFISQETRVEEG
ncbi:uncharacterized protein LOC123322393 [Coccinella septempunctata]|uniref:uncharacterized protein LOC123322393 n=1 Tax=Coccinella septempunctata TaxID=41139 RepID=UPI001D07B2B4|nr:uncharacterized protein LOC123322393 [Coccinella septempunctata]